jgi:hypothetical protein
MRAHLLLAALGASCTSSPQPRSTAPDSPPFDVAQLRADIRFLASDLLEGRRAGTHGYDVAAEYVAARFAMMGIPPGGQGSYFQPLQLREVTPDLAASTVELSDPALAAAIHVPDSAIVSADLAHLDLELAGPMTYVGKGVCDVDTGRDDGGGDLHGRFAVVLAGVADGLPAARAAVRSEITAKWACVASHGAIGIVALRTRKATVLPWASTIASYRSGAMGLLDAGVGRSRSVPAPILTLDEPAARAALAAAGRDLDAEEARAADGKPERFDLPGTLKIRYRAHARDLASANVIGRIEGSDPALAREAVVVSAHLDHLGVNASGAIRNGAIDNASGIAQLLAIARALTAQPHPPRRTVILLATTGEELGLLGAEGFTAHPQWPIDRIVANLNIDQTGMMWPIVDVVADGAERSSLAASAARAAAALGLAVSPDPVPEQGFFLRSDQAPFARAGVPAMIYRPGFRDRSGGSDRNRALFMKWRSTAYHSPLDKLDQRDPPIDFDSGITMARLIYLTALDVANADQRPRWNPGDVFAPR